MSRSISWILCCVLAGAVGAGADGLLVPSAPGYPKDLLRNRLTEVKVEIDGLVARTSAYQEFVNEWDEATDAVYSFPLPPGARATNFVYWSGDRAYQAVVEEREQAVNPGTGEGGTAGEINRYLAADGIKIELRAIPSGGIQRVRLDYIETCRYFRGRCSYRYPLDTGDFVTHAIDQLVFEARVRSGGAITTFDLPSHKGWTTVEEEFTGRRVEVRLEEAKAFLDRDIEFFYEVEQEELGVDFYSVAPEDGPGHFALFVRPPAQADPGTVVRRRVLFLLSNSSRMFGARLDQSAAAIARGLDLLGEGDQFNIMLFGNSVVPWLDAPVAATADNKAQARAFLENIDPFFGSRLDMGLRQALGQILDDRFANAIVAFTDGRSPLDPREIARLNLKSTGIFPIGIGDNLDRARLEMTATLNRGFVTYLDDDDDLGARIGEVIEQISQPVLVNTVIEYGRAGLDQILPEDLPATYAGSFFFTTGRYLDPGLADFSLSGLSSEGIVAFGVPLDFSARVDRNRFARHLWAKETIDSIEREIAVYGEDAAGVLRQRIVDLSLTYNLRSRFTAFVADYETEYVPPPDEDLGLTQGVSVSLGSPTVAADSQGTPVEERSYLAGNYPNPFNASTTVRLFLDASAVGQTKLLKVYDILGQLVDVIDISGLRPGWHEVRLNGRDLFGRPLATGIYFVRLQIGNRAVGAIRVHLLR